MIAFVLQRLLQGIVVMLVVGFIAFSLFNFVGDPVSLMLPPEATQADREAMRTSLGLDKPFYQQFVTFVHNAVQIKALVSKDGLRQFRPPQWKPRLEMHQANFQSREVPSGAWTNNGHLEIIDQLPPSQ